MVKDQPIDPGKVQQHMERVFGESLADVRRAMEDLASAFNPAVLGVAAYGLYERFRPRVDSGQKGWRQRGKLDLALIRSLAVQ